MGFRLEHCNIRTAITTEQLSHDVPIDIEQFEDPESLGEPSTSERVLRFLIAHADRAYTRSEIADAIGADPETVGTNLTRLKSRELVRHREPYWAFTDDHEQARAALQKRGADDLAALLSEPDRDDSPDADRDGQETSVALTPDGPHRAAASAFVERTRNQLGDVIGTLYLFGSVARRTETVASDVDVLVVIADEADFQHVDEQLLDIAFDVQLEFDVPIEVHSISAGEFEARRERGEPFVRTVVEEGVRGD